MNTDAVNVISAIVEAAEVVEEQEAPVEVVPAEGREEQGELVAELVAEAVVEVAQAEREAEEAVAAQEEELAAQEAEEAVVAGQHGVILVKMAGNAFRPSLRCLLPM